MNTQLLTARDPVLKAEPYSATASATPTATATERLARRAGLALVRWSARRVERTEVSRERVELRRAAEALRAESLREVQLLVLLNRGRL